MNDVKLSVSVASPVYVSLEKMATEVGQDTRDYIQRLLTQHVLNKNTIDDDAAERLQLTWRVIDKCVCVARKICRDGRFNEHITLDVFRQCADDCSWKEDYTRYIKGGVYKHGNSVIGAKICTGIGGVSMKYSNGNSKRKSVSGEIIDSYTLYESFDPEAVRDSGSS